MAVTAGGPSVDVYINVVGAEKTNAAIKETGKALETVEPAARKADAGLKQVERTAQQAGKATKDAGDSAGKTAGAWQQFAGLASKGSEAFGKLTFGAQALSTVIGLGIGGGLVGALGGALQAFGALFDVIQRRLGPSIQELAAQGAALSEQQVKEALRVNDLSEAYERYAAGLGLAADKLTTLERQKALRQVASGELQTRETAAARIAELQERQADLQRDIKQADAYLAEGRLVNNPERPARLRAELADVEAKIQQATMVERSLVGRGPLREAANAAVSRLRPYVDLKVEEARQYWDAARRFEAARVGAPTAPAPTTPSGGRGGGAPSRPDVSGYYGALGISERGQEERARQRAQAEAEAARTELERRQAEARRAREAAIAEGRRAEGAGGRETQSDVDARVQATMRAGPAGYGAAIGDSMRGLASSATDSAGIFAAAVSTINNSFGSMFANLLATGETGTKNFKRFIGEQLLGLAAQALGYSTLLGGLAIAAALTGPILGWSAGGLATAAGVMAGTGAALAITAGGLGAKAQAIGGGGGGKGGGGGGGGGSGRIGGNGGYGIRDRVMGGLPANFTVIVGIGRGQLHDAVVDESDARGSSRGRRAVSVRSR